MNPSYSLLFLSHDRTMATPDRPRCLEPTSLSRCSEPPVSRWPQCRKHCWDHRQGHWVLILLLSHIERNSVHKTQGARIFCFSLFWLIWTEYSENVCACIYSLIYTALKWYAIHSLISSGSIQLASLKLN